MGLQQSAPAHRESRGFVHALKPTVEQKREKDRGGGFGEGFHEAQEKEQKHLPSPEPSPLPKDTWWSCGCQVWRYLTFLSGHAGPEMEPSLPRGPQRALGLGGHLLGVWLDFMVLAVWMIC